MPQDLIPGSAIPFGAPALTAGGINGLGSLRFVGTTNGGAPTSGTYNTNDVILDKQGYVWVCTSGGSPGTWTSLQSVLNHLPIGGNWLQFTTSTSMTIPSYVTRLYVILVGAGGGGGGSGGIYVPSGTSQYYSVAGAGGGGGGAIVFGWVPVSGGPTLTITVGAGGAGGAGGPSTSSSQGVTQGGNGGSGGDTVVSIGSTTLATAQGGQGGSGSDSSPGFGGSGGGFSTASNSILFGVSGQSGGKGSSLRPGSGGTSGTAPYLLNGYGNGGQGANQYTYGESIEGVSGSNGQNGCVFVIW